jgi:hypothetical protein
MADTQYLTVELHNEYARRMEEEHERQNERIKVLEKSSKENTKLIISVEKLATSVQTMAQEQKAQGERLEELENKDGEMWRKVVSYAVTAIIGIIIGFIFKQLGM